MLLAAATTDRGSKHHEPARRKRAVGLGKASI